MRTKLSMGSELPIPKACGLRWDPLSCKPHLLQMASSGPLRFFVNGSFMVLTYNWEDLALPLSTAHPADSAGCLGLLK